MREVPLSNPTVATLRRTRAFAALTLLVVGVVVGCRPTSSTSDAGVRVEVAFAHPPPVVGPNVFSLALDDADGHPLSAAKLEVEGDMNHAGMTPSFARVNETAPGRYTGTIEFTMGGDWFLLVSGERADHRRFRQKVNVPGVGSK